MKLFLSTISTALAVAGFSTAQESAASVMRFSNGDRLTGDLETLSSDLLVWKSSLLDKPTPFFLKSVVDLTLPGMLPADDADHEAVVSLTNGDIVRGRLASVTDDAVALDTPFCGRLTFKRLNVSGLKVQERRNYTYRGPVGVEGWKISGKPPSWTYGRAAFFAHSQGGIGKEDVVPDECSVMFDASWKDEGFGLKVVIFSKDIDSIEPTSGYEFTFQRGGFLVRNCSGQGGYLGNGQSQEFLENEKVKIEIRASRKTGQLCMLINDRMADSWSDVEFQKGRFGSGLQFISVGSLPLKIAAIGIAELDEGIDQFPEPKIGMGGIRGGGFGLQRFGGGLMANDGSTQTDAKETPKDGRMELSNGDSLEGEVTAIDNGVINVKTPLGEVKLPVARLRDINVKSASPETCIRRKGDIRASMPDGSSIVFRMDGVANGLITGSSQNFGAADFKIDAISRIEFNIYDPELEGKRVNEEW